MSLVEDTLLFAQALETSHLNLVTVRHVYEASPLDMASYEVERGRLKKAIEALERGRPPIWSEFRGLCNSINELPVDWQFAKEFTAVNRELVSEYDDDEPKDGEGMDMDNGDFISTCTRTRVKLKPYHKIHRGGRGGLGELNGRNLSPR